MPVLAVTVTAQRRTENIKDVPVSVTLLKDEKLDVLLSGGQDIRLLAGKVPSLNVESSNGRTFPRFYIRGYGNTDFNTFASQPVSLVYDDVVQENPILKGFPAFDLEQIEIARGPQGTLFGRNTPSGVVKFNSVKPGKKAEEPKKASPKPAVPVELTADEIADMQRMLRIAMEEGAWGWSTTNSPTHAGPQGQPVPTRLANDEERVELGALAGERQQCRLRPVEALVMHAVVDACLALRRDHNVMADTIAEIVVSGDQLLLDRYHCELAERTGSPENAKGP